MKKYFRLLIFALMVLAPVMPGINAFAGTTVNVQALYERWHDYDLSRLMEMGGQFDIAESPDSALVCYTIVSDKLVDNKMSDEESRIYVRALVNLAYISGSYFFDYSKALAFLQTAAGKSKALGYTENLSYVYLNMGSVYLAFNEIYGNKLFSEEIWRYLDMSISAGIESKTWPVVLAAITNICSLYPDNPQKEKFSSVIKRIEEANIPSDVPMRNYTQELMEGTKAYSLGDYTHALQHFLAMQEYITSPNMQSNRYRCIAWSAAADAYAGLGEYNQAIALTNKILDLAKSEHYDDEAARALHKLSQYYSSLGNDDKAQEYLLSYYATKDSIVSEREVANLSSMPLTNEINAMAQEIKQERKKKFQIIIGICVSVVFILLLALYLLRMISSNRKLREYSKQIYHKYVDALEAENREKNLRKSLELLKQDVVKTPIPSADTPKKRYINSTISPETVRDIEEKIEQILANSDVISDPKFSLHNLSDSVGYSYKLVSQVINETLGKNFKTLLNEHRIKEVCNRLIDKENYGDYTIEHIAQSVGFVSRSNFSVTFKSVVGITPSEFLRNAREDGQR